MPTTVSDPGQIVTLAHGNGGRLTRGLIDGIFAPLFDRHLDTRVDAAAVPAGEDEGDWLITTDGFTVEPLEFPGGNIGSLAVQLAKGKGAYVIALARGDKAEFVKGLGADEFIDGDSQRFEDVVGHVDVVLDTIGGAVQEASWQTLKPGGLLMATATPPPADRARAASVRAAFVFTPASAAVLAELAKRVDAGRLHAFVGEEFALADAMRAHQLGESGKARGKMVLHVAPPVPR